MDAAKMEELKKAMLNAATEIRTQFNEIKEIRISCHQARTIAEQFAVPYGVIGQMADDLKIKIRHCELGCF